MFRNFFFFYVVSLKPTWLQPTLPSVNETNIYLIHFQYIQSLPLRAQCCLYLSLTSSSSWYFPTSRSRSLSSRGFMSRFCSARLRLEARAISLSSWMFWICEEINGQKWLFIPWKESIFPSYTKFPTYRKLNLFKKNERKEKENNNFLLVRVQSITTNYTILMLHVRAP